MALKQLGEVQQEMTVIKDRLAELAEMPDPTEGDEVARSKALDERANETDDLIKRWDELKQLEGPLLERSRRLDEVRQYALASANVDGGDGSAPSRFGAAFHKQVDPFEGDLVHLGRKEVIERARRVVGEEKRVNLRDDSRDQVDRYIQRGLDSSERDQFDGGYIARRTLLTENPAYRSAFQKYAAGRQIATMTRAEVDAVSAFHEHEDYVARAMSENTTTAGGFGIPVKVAA